MAQYWLSDPWSSDPWMSFDQLRRGMDQLFERAGAGTARRAGAFPPVNLYETKDGYVLTAELPGVSADELEISIERNRLTLGGQRAIERPQDASVHRAERASGSFRRTVELPNEVDADKAEASHRNGVLMLRLPKQEKHQPRRIAVKAS
jgi:HSP20 family protein